MDADLLSLSLLVRCPGKQYLYREDHFDKNIVHIVDVQKLKEGVLKTFVSVGDFVVALFFVGNDFFPRSKVFNLYNDGYVNIANAYVKTRKIIKSTLTDGNQINKQFLFKMLENLAEKENISLNNYFIRFHTNDIIRFKDPIINKCKEVFMDRFNEVCSETNPEQYKKLWTAAKFESEDQLKLAVLDYLRNIEFVFQYYWDKIPSWSYQYKYDYAPYPSDILKFGSQFKFGEKWDESFPITQFAQLLAVISPKSMDRVLPDKLKPLAKQMEKFYPQQLDIDYEGVVQDYLGVVRLPLITIEDIPVESFNVVDVKNNFGKAFTISSFMNKDGSRVVKKKYEQ
jgi:5'-3' exoribonuclease 2